jgi:RNA polymerase sigma-70 factor (ECF subfamily)
MNDHPDDLSSFDRALADARTGGEQGLTALFRAFHPRVLRYLRAREPRRADDIAGETWLAVAAQIRSFEGDSRAFAAWIFVIARQRLADHRRTAARRRTDPAAVVPELQPASSSEELVMDSIGGQAAVDRIVRLLSRDQAEVVLLRVLAGLSAADIASIMDRDEGWVRVTLHRAMNRLRDGTSGGEM